MKLGLRLALVTSLVAMVPLVLTGVLSARMAAEEVSEGRRDGLALHANAHAAFVTTWVDGRLRSLEGWRDVYGGRWDDLDETQRIGFLRQVYRSEGNAGVVALLDADGEPLVEPVYLTEGVSDGLARSRADVGAFLRSVSDTVVLAPQEPSVGLYRTPEGVPTLSAVVALDEALGWSLAVQLSLDEALAPLNESTGALQAVLLMDETGEPFSGQEHRLIDPDVLRSLRGTDSSFRYRHPEEGFVYGETRPVARTGWTLAVVEPASVVWAPAQGVVRSVAVVALLNLLMALVLARASAGTLVRPILALQRAAGRVAEGDYEATITTVGQGELEELARSFQTMTEALAEQRDEILAFQSDLQRRVEDRTASLRLASREIIERRERAAVSAVGAGLAHELNNPLASVLGIAQLLRGGKEAPDGSGPLLGKLEQEAERCRQIVHQMLTLTEHGEAGRVRATFAVEERIEACIERVASRFADRNIRLTLSASSPCEVVGDPARLGAVIRAVFDALVGVAPLGSDVRVRVEGARDTARVTWEVFGEDGVLSEHETGPNQEVMGYAVWVAREMAHRLGARLDTSEHGQLSWCLWLGGEGDA